jgi:hypothetical protein
VRNAPTDVELLTDPGDLGLADPAVGAQRDDQVIHAAGRDAVHVGLHHHRVERLIDAAPGFEDGGEVGALPELRDPQLDVAGLGRQQLGTGAVAFGDTILGALVALRTDHAGGFELHELLQDRADRLTDPIDAITGTKRLEQLGQGRLGQGHRWSSFSA